jgi:hypothetical protein
MKAYQKTTLYVFASMLFLISALMLTVPPVDARTEKLVWEGIVYSSGDEVTTSVILESGKIYRIEVGGTRWWYNYPGNLSADAQYYTTDPSDSWNWGNHFSAPPPGSGHSFLQINSENVDWGAFSNGDTGHSYSIYLTGQGTAITFRIVDWVDGNVGNNYSHLWIKIYREITVGGHIVDSIPMEITASKIIVTLLLAAVVTVPIIQYRRKSRPE